MSIKVGSRKSQLALIQTESVVNDLKSTWPNNQLNFEIVSMTTIGDQILDKALSKIGERSLFTKELEIALEKREVSLVVHSLKDLPTTLHPGMVIGAICRRSDPSDAVVFPRDSVCASLEELKPGSVVGTSSLRRIAQLQRLYPNLSFQTIRGNLNTRFKKLDDGETYSAIILAAAGLKRMSLGHRIGRVLPRNECMYAVGQGALAVECRQDDPETLKLLSPLFDADTLLCCIAERALMKTLAGGCSVPIAVWSSISKGTLELTGGVFSLDGSTNVVKTSSAALEDWAILSDPDWTKAKSFCGVAAPSFPERVLSVAEKLGINLADDLLADGAGEILKEIVQMNHN